MNSYNQDTSTYPEIVQPQPIEPFLPGLWDFQQVAHWHHPFLPNHNPHEINWKTWRMEKGKTLMRKTPTLHLETKGAVVEEVEEEVQVDHNNQWPPLKYYQASDELKLKSLMSLTEIENEPKYSLTSSIWCLKETQINTRPMMPRLLMGLWPVFHAIPAFCTSDLVWPMHDFAWPVDWAPLSPILPSVPIVVGQSVQKLQLSGSDKSTTCDKAEHRFRFHPG